MSTVMNRFLLVPLLFCTLGAIGALPMQKFDGPSRIALSAPTSRGASAITLAVGTDAPDDLEGVGAEILAYSGGVALVTVPREQLEALAALPGVRTISLPRRLTLTNDLSRHFTGGEAVHAGADLPSGFDGSGVIAGIFDVGVDPNHIMFLDADGRSRVSRIFHYAGDDGVEQTYDTPDAIAAFTTDDDIDTHGTHTTGTLAGCYNGTVSLFDNGADVLTANPFSGYMTGAEIAVGCGWEYDANIMAACARIADYASANGKPCVINLSLGEVLGPRDGTEHMAAFLNSLADKAIIVLAAGNDAQGQRTFSHTFTESRPDFRTCLRPWDPAKPVEGVVDIWGSRGSGLTLTLGIVDYKTGEVLGSFAIPRTESEFFSLATTDRASGQETTDATFDRQFSDSYIKVTYSANEATNDRPSYYIEYYLTPDAEGNPGADRSVALWLSGAPGGRVDGGASCTNFRFHGGALKGYTTPNGEMSVSSIACGPDVICVGAYTTRREWTSLTGDPTGLDGYTVGAIAPFSSYGTLVDGRNLPHVCAPGASVVSSYSSYYEARPSEIIANAKVGDKTYHWGIDYGTSMATPAVAGIIGLWLQACPTLSVSQIRQIIAETSVRDQQVTADRNPVAWGAGKIDAVAGLRRALEIEAALTGGVSVGGGDILVTGAGGKVFIQSPGAALGQIRVADLSGRMVAQCFTDDTMAELDCPGGPGVYIVSTAAGVRKVTLRP